MPAAAPPYTGPRRYAENSTTASPMLTYPFAERGICISIVATQVIAASIDATTSFFAEKVKDDLLMYGDDVETETDAEAGIVTDTTIADGTETAE